MTPQKVNDLIAVGQGDQNKPQKNQREKKKQEKSQKVWFFMQNLASVANSVVSTLSSDVSISENDIKEKEITK